MRLIVAAVLAVSPWLERWPATVIRRRLHAARLRGDGLSRAALVSLPGIVLRGLGHPAAASRPPCLEEASLCGENAGLDAEAHLRGPGFARELTSGTAAAPRFRTFQVCPKHLPPARWQADRAEIGVSTCDRRRSAMNEQVVQERRAPDIAAVALYSVVLLLVTFLSVYIPA
jgi:hypothetical protein